MLIDAIVVSLIAVFFIIGAAQGFIASLHILIAWAIGILSIFLFSGYFAGILNSNMVLVPPMDLLLGGILAFIIIFLSARIVVSIVNFFLTKTTALTMANRMLGGAWGALKGIAISAVLLTIVNAVPAKGTLKKTMDESTAFSVYNTFPFASAWDKLKLPKELKLDIDSFKEDLLEDPSKEDHHKGPI
ncbi:MAG: CvpA family protein [Fibromonadaceae bacterium]|nr:CvpA family protein [Fibromonadaceae bacterium]